MTIAIRRLRMSLIWSTPFATLIKDNPPPDAPLLALGKRESYQSIFERLLRLRAVPGCQGSPRPDTEPALELPWEAHGVNNFWCRYLNANFIGLKRLSGNSAFFRLVPLRRHESPACGLSVPLEEKNVGKDKVIPEVVVRTEAWFHPHMVSFAVNFNIHGAMSLETAARVCLGLRKERLIFRSPHSPIKLDELAAEKLDELYTEAVGERNAAPVPLVNPFSVVTVLQGDGSSPNDTIIDGEPVHRFLETATQWDEDKQDNLVTGRISSWPVPNPQDLTGPLLFGRRRSRAVWDPRRFLPRGDGKSSLSCYHRNLMVSSLQTEALLAFAHLAVEQQAADGARSKTIRQCEKFVLMRLIELHSDQPYQTDTYCSINLQRIIDESPYRAAVNAIADWNFSNVRLP